MNLTYYQLLGIATTATPAEIKMAFRAMAIKYHPDKHGGSREYELKFKLINEAYQVLSDPKKKHLYDLKLQYAAAMAHARETTMDPASPYMASQIFRQQARHASYNPQQPRQPQGQYQQRQAAPRPQPQARRRGFTRPDREMTLKDYGILVLAILCLVGLGTVVKFTMDHVTAVDRYKTALEMIAEERYAAAHSNLREAIYFKPTYGEALLKKGDLELAVYGSPTAALEDYNEAFRNLTYVEPKSYYMRAKCYIQLKQFRHADKDLSYVLRQDSTLALASLDRGIVRLQHLHQPQEALSDFNRFIRLGTDRSLVEQAWQYRGFTYQQLGQVDQAISDYHRALQLDPRDALTYSLVAEAQLAKGDTTLGCAYFAKSYNLGNYAAEIQLRRYCGRGKKP